MKGFCLPVKSEQNPRERITMTTLNRTKSNLKLFLARLRLIITKLKLLALENIVEILDYFDYLKERREYLKLVDTFSNEEIQKRLAEYVRYIVRIYGTDEINYFMRYKAKRKINANASEHEFWKSQLLNTEDYLQQKIDQMNGW
jgi:hypothetical protein